MAYETKSEALETVVATAHQELVDIGTEMQDDFDEKGERWQEGDKGQEMLAAAEVFASLDYPEPPDALKSNTIEWPRTIYKNPTRAQRVEICVPCVQSLRPLVTMKKTRKPRASLRRSNSSLMMLSQSSRSADERRLNTVGGGALVEHCSHSHYLGCLRRVHTCRLHLSRSHRHTHYHTVIIGR